MPTHKAVLLYGAKDFRCEELPTKEPEPHEVQIATRATGICGTDLHYYQHGRNGSFVVESPLVLGHEASGQVLRLGNLVEKQADVRVGDRVAIEPQRPCSSCTLCRRGKYNLCPKLRFTGSASARPPVQGSLQEIYNHPASLVYKLPDNMSFAEGAMVEPLSVAIHAVRRSHIEAGQSVLITGAGAIGLLCAAVSRLSGARSISMIDIEASRLAFAKQHGFADQTMLMPMERHEGESTADFARRLASHSLAESEWDRADISFECTGIETCANFCIHSAAPGGKVVIVGMGSALQTLDLFAAAVREIDILSVWRYANTFEDAIRLVGNGVLDLKPLITHTFKLSEADRCLQTILAKPPNLIKSVIVSEFNGLGSSEVQSEAGHVN